MAFFLMATTLCAQDFCVRVLLDELNDGTNWLFKNSQGFYLADPVNSQKRLRSVKNTLLVEKKKDDLYINGSKFLPSQVAITPIEGERFFFHDVEYHGSCMLVKNKGKWLLINLVPLEEYVHSVLRTETWPGWPLEVIKVCAIACRTYVMNMAMKINKGKKPYHVSNTNKHQTYTGLHEDKIMSQAIDETRGVFVSYKNKPILAMYDICCGGVIPAYISGFNFLQAPYLARKQVCTHCKKAKAYSWSAQVPVAEFYNRIGHAMPTKRIKDIKISKKDKAGLVQSMGLLASGRWLTVPIKQLYGSFKELKSFCFTVKKQADSIVFTGKGYGHHIGLCQWGAREMVRDNWDYKRILQFYYPGTNLMKLT